MKRRPDPRQLTLVWTAAAGPPSETVASDAGDEPPVQMDDLTELDRSPLLQVLPWDFSTTYPSVLPDAVDAGLVDDDEVAGEALASLHAAHEKELLAALVALDQIQDARCRGVNLDTGRAPRSAAKKLQLVEQLGREIARLERWWAILLETYATIFGSVAAEAFGHCIRARHAGVEVMAMPGLLTGAEPDRPAVVMELQPTRPNRPRCLPNESPNPWPLRQAVHTGVFGRDDAGRGIEPCEDEVREITQRHAEVLTELVRAFRVAASSERVASEAAMHGAAEKYTDDFGEQAAEALLAYCHQRASDPE